jgi:hypothetical protein
MLCNRVRRAVGAVYSDVGIYVTDLGAGMDLMRAADCDAYTLRIGTAHNLLFAVSGRSKEECVQRMLAATASLPDSPDSPEASPESEPLAGGSTAGRAQYNPAEPQGVEHRSAEREQAAGNLACAREIDKKLGAALAVVEAAKPIVEKIRELGHLDPITCAVVGPWLFRWDEALRAFDAKGEK